MCDDSQGLPGTAPFLYERNEPGIWNALIMACVTRAEAVRGTVARHHFSTAVLCLWAKTRNVLRQPADQQEQLHSF